jgi:hypothetical protein
MHATTCTALTICGTQAHRCDFQLLQHTGACTSSRTMLAADCRHACKDGRGGTPWRDLHPPSSLHTPAHVSTRSPYVSPTHSNTHTLISPPRQQAPQLACLAPAAAPALAPPPGPLLLAPPPAPPPSPSSSAPCWQPNPPCSSTPPAAPSLRCWARLPPPRPSAGCRCPAA